MDGSCFSSPSACHPRAQLAGWLAGLKIDSLDPACVVRKGTLAPLPTLGVSFLHCMSLVLCPEWTASYQCGFLAFRTWKRDRLRTSLCVLASSPGTGRLGAVLLMPCVPSTWDGAISKVGR